MFMKKLSMLFFILGTLISLFSGAFAELEEMKYLKISLLVVFGAFIGLFNISKEEENKFLLASLVFVVCSLAFKEFPLSEGQLHASVSIILLNLVYFISSGAIIVSLRAILGMASEGEYESKKIEHLSEEEDVMFYHIWDIFVFIAVAFVFILLVLDIFKVAEEYASFLSVVDFLIWTIFVVDLFFLYFRSKGLKDFLKRSWLDIIAVIPFNMLKVFKFARMFRIARLFTRTSKLSKAVKVTKLSKGAKVLHMSKALKFFSSESGFNKYLDEDVSHKIKRKSKRTKKKTRRKK